MIAYFDWKCNICINVVRWLHWSVIQSYVHLIATSNRSIVNGEHLLGSPNITIILLS